MISSCVQLAERDKQNASLRQQLGVLQQAVATVVGNAAAGSSKKL